MQKLGRLVFCVLLSIIIIIIIGLVAGQTDSFESSKKSAKFEVSYLDTEIPIDSIRNDSLGVEEVVNQVGCSLACLNKRGCLTSLFKMEGNTCTMLKRFLKSTQKYGHSQTKKKNSKVVVLRASDPCLNNPCHHGRRCAVDELGLRCFCAHDERGELCETKLTGKSCLDIKLKHPNATLKSGLYEIGSTKIKTKFRVYCDMQFDQGGWMRVMKVEHKKEADFGKFTEISTLEGLAMERNYVSTGELLLKLRGMTGFQQFRFECESSTTKRKLHIKTNTSRPAVVDYLVGATDNQPASCGSYTRYEEDESKLTKDCDTWDNGVWGLAEADENGRLTNHPMFVKEQYHWLLSKEDGRFECDNRKPPLAVMDYWHVFVR